MIRIDEIRPCVSCRQLHDTITRLHAEIAEHKISNARLSQRLREHEAHQSETVRVPVLEARVAGSDGESL